eukprot:NP_001257251.1 Uncharacterized protein CELE_C27C12.5 [Caenorhabditis elegans]
MTETSNCSSSSSEYEEEEERIVLHVYDDESKEFTSLTTYHGMIRIYTSETWPSRIFWGVVVVTCVTLFMIQGGVLLEFYNSHPTATKIDEYRLPTSFLPSISICPYGFKTDDNLFYLITQGDKDVYIPPDYWKNSSKQLLKRLSYKCEDVVESIMINPNQIIDFCANSRTQITEIGKCFTFENWREFETNTLKIKLKKMYTAHIHSEYYEVSRSSTQAWLKPGSHAKLSFRIEEQHNLPQNNWGTCKVQTGEIYNHLGCLEQCLVAGYDQSCHCSPFFNRFTRFHCSIDELLNCPKLKEVPCDCPMQCYSQNYVLQPVSLLKSRSNISTVTFHLNSNLLRSHQQYKRFKQIDLMSYIGGVMGLFLGMSCVTLLEVFIYLFKTIFGTLNSTRHKAFIERLLSNEDGSIHGSHEEIIITQKIEKTVQKETLEQPLEQVADTRPLAERRFSLMPNNQLGVKVQFHRPNHLLKRNSVYLGNCDF